TELAASLGNVERDRQRSAPELVAQGGVSPRNFGDQVGGHSEKPGGSLVSIEALEPEHAPFSAAEALRVRLRTRQRLRQRLGLRPGPRPRPRPRPQIQFDFRGDSLGVRERAGLAEKGALPCARPPLSPALSRGRERGRKVWLRATGDF